MTRLLHYQMHHGAAQEVATALAPSCPQEAQALLVEAPMAKTLDVKRRLKKDEKRIDFYLDLEGFGRMWQIAQVES